MNVRRLTGVCVVLFLVACHQETAAPQQETSAPAAATISIVPTVPADVPGGADKADLPAAARFAWQQFIALNWPADPAKRMGNARTFGESLRRVSGFSRATAVYLSGCNTGLEFGGDCIARAGSRLSACVAASWRPGTPAESLALPRRRDAGGLTESL